MQLDDGPDTALARLLAASGRVQVVDLRAALDQARQSRKTGGPALADIIIQRGLISLAELEATYLSALRRPDGSVRPASGLEDPSTTLGRYVILDELGRGGMGVVLKAFDPTAGDVVAIKKILGAVGPDELLRFEREAQIMNRLEHPGIATLREVVSSGPGAPYLVLDFVEGETLRARTQRGPLPPLEAAETLLGITRAMSAAQEQGIVHRDLKPDNVMLTRDGPVVLDFGLARRVIDESVPATLSGEVLGTPCYMAPEQARAGHSDARTDVYGLGAILYECLTGGPPFNGPFVEVMRAVCERAPDPPTRRAPGTPAVLEAICLRCLQKAPAKRYPSADALARDLETFLATAQANSALGRVVAPAAPAAKSERSLVVIGVGTFAALLAVVLTIGLVLTKPDPAPAAPVAAASPSLPPPPPEAKPLEAAQARQRALNRAASDLRAGVPTPTIVAALAAALDRPPAPSASVLTRAALVCLNAGANEQAEAYFARAIEQDARQLLPLYWLDVLRHPTCGPLATTLQERAEAAGGLNHPLALLARARLANGANDPRQALLLADRALAYRPHLAPALRERAQAHLAQADAQAALVDFNRSYEQTPAWVTLLRIGRIQVDLLQVLDANRTLARLLRRRPDDVVCLTQRGRAQLYAKRYLEARRDLDRAITLGVNHPERYRAFEARGELHTEQGRSIDASADYRNTLQLAPPDAHPERGRAEFGLGNLTKAEQHFTALIRSGSLLTFAGHRGRAKTRQRLGRLPEARRDLDAWIRLQPKDGTAYLQRAHLLLILKDYPPAKADLDRVIRLRPDQPEGFFFRGVWHGETGDTAAADADWRRAWRLAPAGSRLRDAIRRARPGLFR